MKTFNYFLIIPNFLSIFYNPRALFLNFVVYSVNSEESSIFHLVQSGL